MPPWPISAHSIDWWQADLHSTCAAQIIEVLAILALSCILFVPLYYGMARIDRLRIPVEQEIAGLDASRWV
jgi:hypothetical protein